MCSCHLADNVALLSEVGMDLLESLDGPQPPVSLLHITLFREQEAIPIAELHLLQECCAATPTGLISQHVNMRIKWMAVLQGFKRGSARHVRVKLLE